MPKNPLEKGRTMPYTLDEIDQLCREIEVAEESALSELTVFGYAEPINPYEEREPFNAAELEAAIDGWTF